MRFKTAEEKLLHDYDILEEENMRLHDENEALKDKVAKLERRISDCAVQAGRIAVERDHHADCVKDMLATAAFYGFEQPAKIMFNPKTGMMQPAPDDDGGCAIYSPIDEGMA